MVVSVKHIHLINNNYQNGATLLEALVALVLTTIIALGGALSIGKILQAQRQSNIQQSAVNQLRQLLQSGTNLCSSTSNSITVNSQNLAVTVTCTSQTTTVGGKSITIQKPVLSVDDSALGGQVSVGE